MTKRLKKKKEKDFIYQIYKQNSNVCFFKEKDKNFVIVLNKPNVILDSGCDYVRDRFGKQYLVESSAYVEISGTLNTMQIFK